MIGLDTNVLVRHMVQDDEAQAALARELLEERCSPAVPGHVALIVLCELVWVLGSAYGYTRGQIALALGQILVTDCLDVEEHALAWAALRDYETSGADYADAIISRLNRTRGSRTTFTFDRKAARVGGFTLLTGPTV